MIPTGRPALPAISGPLGNLVAGARALPDLDSRDAVSGRRGLIHRIVNNRPSLWTIGKPHGDIVR